MGSSSTGPVACPRCGLIDHVQKVSAVVRVGAMTASYAGQSSGFADTFDAYGNLVVTSLSVDTTLTGGQQTMLSQQLAAPAQPEYQSPWGQGSLAVVAVLSGMMILACLGAWSGEANPPPGGGVPWWLALLALTVCIGPVLLGPIMVLAWVKQRETKKRRALFAEDYQNWQRAMMKWNGLYYCSRDDVVFLPGTRQMAGASAMMQFVYS